MFASCILQCLPLSDQEPTSYSFSEGSYEGRHKFKKNSHLRTSCMRGLRKDQIYAQAKSWVLLLKLDRFLIAPRHKKVHWVYSGQDQEYLECRRWAPTPLKSPWSQSFQCTHCFILIGMAWGKSSLSNCSQWDQLIHSSLWKCLDPVKLQLMTDSLRKQYHMPNKHLMWL